MVAQRESSKIKGNKAKKERRSRLGRIHRAALLERKRFTNETGLENKRIQDRSEKGKKRRKKKRKEETRAK